MQGKGNLKQRKSSSGLFIPHVCGKTEAHMLTATDDRNHINEFSCDRLKIKLDTDQL